MHLSLRRRLLAALTVALTGLLGLSAVTGAAAAGSSYVALGDSYSSGTGTRSYLADGTTCQRSVYAYPALVAAARGYTLSFRACSGARIPDVTDSQLSALSGSTGYVTISVGGNDAGFAGVITECAKPWWAGNCNRAVDAAQRYVTGTLPAALSTLYASIRAKAPNAKVVVVGYPRIFMGEDCNAATWFSSAEMSRLNQTADLINSTTAQAAAAQDFSFANPTSRFVGHAVCADAEWINGLSYPITESYHPDRAGHSSGYTPVVSPVLTGSTVTVTAATRTAARASADELAARQRPYAAVDRAIEPETFVAPDLTSRAMRAAARRAGIDLDRWIARQQAG